jgi:uncharacterized membrane protein YcaP (DUF421 family)
MNEWETLFGSGEKLTALQMSMRAGCMFFITLALIRLSGMRTFGKKSAFDIIISIMLGAILSRGITGASSFVGCVAAATVMVIIHRLLAWLSIKSKNVGKIVKGKYHVLYKNGEIQWENMRRSLISMHDLQESIREEINEDGFDKVDSIFIERNGRITVVKKQ